MNKSLSLIGFSLGQSQAEDKLADLAGKVTNGVALATKELGVAPTTGFHYVMSHIRESTPVLVESTKQLRSSATTLVPSTEEATDAAEYLRTFTSTAMPAAAATQHSLSKMLHVLKERKRSTS